MAYSRGNSEANELCVVAGTTPAFVTAPVPFAAQLKGPFPKRMVKRHFLACHSLEVLEPSFDEATFKFKRKVTDPVTGAPTLKLETVMAPTEDLQAILLRNMSPGDDKCVDPQAMYSCFVCQPHHPFAALRCRASVLQFKDLLDRMTALDPLKRITIKEALTHPFITGETAKK